MTAAAMISLLRLGLAPLVAGAILGGRRGLALLVLAGAMATDVADGPVARRTGTASEAGAGLSLWSRARWRRASRPWSQSSSA